MEPLHGFCISLQNLAGLLTRTKTFVNEPVWSPGRNLSRGTLYVHENQAWKTCL